MYLEHFRLQQEPFSLSPNLELYCDLPNHQAATKLLNYALSQGDCLVKVTGDVGVGKTLLCRKLLEQFDPEKYASCYIFNPYLSSEDLLTAIATDLGAKVTKGKSRFDLIEIVNKKLLQHHKNNKKTVIIIDEAQLLPPESLEILRLLTNLETPKEKLLHIILVGQQELDSRLSQPNMRQILQRIGFSFHLNKLSRQHIKQYVSRRLIGAGHDYGDIFTNTAIRSIHRFSKGVPRVINIICNKAMLISSSAGKQTVGYSEVWKAARDSKMLLKTINANRPRKNWVSWAVIGGVGTIALAAAIFYAVT